jgi:hypothetical protein
MPRTAHRPTRVILFGPFDRHNLGDLLFEHIASALLPGRELVVAGLAERDMRPFGGHHVRALADVARDWPAGRPVTVLHAGGEVLTCSAWQAAAMLLPPDEAAPTIAHLEHHPGEQRGWVCRMLQTDALAPYAAARRFFAPGATVRTGYLGVGGVGLSALPDEMRAEVLEDLRAAVAVTVRDRWTQAHLQGAGIRATLLPDPAVMVAELFGELIRERSLTGETARAVATHLAGFLAVQCSAEFAADVSLDALAQQVQRAARAEGLGVVLFRAGAAPWHDDLATLRRLAERLPAVTATVFESLDVWDICALIAASRGVLASSLHAQIVAAALGRPSTQLRSPAAPPGPTKHEAYAQTWVGDDQESERTLSPKNTRAKDLFRCGFAEVVAALEPPGP